MPSMHMGVNMYVQASVCLSRFCINLYISFICEDIFKKFQIMFMAIKTCLQTFGLILQNKMGVMANFLEIIML